MRSSRRFATVGALAAVAACSAAVLAPPAGATNDPSFDRQWNLAAVGAPAAWAHSTGAGVTIGIVDTGIDATHPDLAGKVDAMADCVGGTCRAGRAPDGQGHGTAVAGVAAANTGNGIGIAGVAPDAHLVVARALDDDGVGRTEDINNGIRWVVDHGARVVNLSLGGADLTVVSRIGTPLRTGIEYAWSRGAIPVLASGNYEPGVTGDTANYGDMDAVVVGATDRTGAVSSYSTSLGNAKWGLVAPGGNGNGPDQDVLAPLPGRQYDWVAGTSLATPHVTGALALLLAEGLDPSAAVNRLLATLDQSVPCGTGCRGRLRIDAAVAPPATATMTQATTPATTQATTAATASATQRARASNATPAQAGSGSRTPMIGLAVVLLLAAAGGTVWAGRRAPRGGSSRPAPFAVPGGHKIVSIDADSLWGPSEGRDTAA